MKTFLAIFFTCLSYSLSPAQDIEFVINKYMEATGGVEQWDAVKTCYVELKGWINMNNNGVAPGTDLLAGIAPAVHKRYNKFPDKQKVTIYPHLQGKTESYDVGGKSVYFTHGRKITRSKSRIARFTPQKLMGFFRKNEIVSLTEDEITGINYYVLVCKKENETHTYFINSETFLLDRYTSAASPGVVIEVFNYQEVEGLKIPFTKEISKNGVLFFKSEITRVDINPELDDEIFEIPDL